MKQPKWQRARILFSDTPAAVGRLIWTRVGPPSYVGAISAHSRCRLPPEDRVDVNILPVHPQCRRAMIRSAGLELLARGPEDFADDVELISWEQWLKESAPEVKP